mmetsp:Transcript_27189/g.59483  ORF Transcript_27189/g.59483 Transcript_27189/m.59483 type:complete len:586 (+) Transcript_27189:83-1840(+)
MMRRRRPLSSSTCSPSDKDEMSKPSPPLGNGHQQKQLARGAGSDLSFRRILVSFLPLLLLLIFASLQHGLHRLAGDVLIASVRTFVQLTCLGAVLTPVFGAKEHSRLGTCSYILIFMLPLAAYEATARSPLTYPGAYLAASAGLATGVIASLSMAIFVVVKPCPWYCPRVVIPLGGMLISNALSGTALAASEMLNEFQNRSERIDLLLAFGATPWEATRSSIASVLSKALMPTVNSMNVIGLVAIPGMMTGQVLGGASPVRAARYQIMIMYLIAASTWLSAGVTTVLTVDSLFDNRGVYLADAIVTNDAPGVSQLLTGGWLQSHGRITGENMESESEDVATTSLLANASPVHLRAEAPLPLSNATPLFELHTSGTLGLERPFFASITLREGEKACLLGKSGIGKSSIIRSMAELSSIASFGGDLTIRLHGVNRYAYAPQEWRKRVMYVPTVAALPGSPAELLGVLGKLKANKRRKGDRFDAVLTYLRQWGMDDPESAMEQLFSDLSGGEAQRVLLAISFACDSDVLLLDEPTSSLDASTKGLVEETILGLERTILLVTHDEEQSLRLGASRWRLASEKGIDEDSQ